MVLPFIMIINSQNSFSQHSTRLGDWHVEQGPSYDLSGHTGKCCPAVFELYERIVRCANRQEESYNSRIPLGEANDPWRGPICLFARFFGFSIIMELYIKNASTTINVTCIADLGVVSGYFREPVEKVLSSS